MAPPFDKLRVREIYNGTNIDGITNLPHAEPVEARTALVQRRSHHQNDWHWRGAPFDKLRVREIDNGTNIDGITISLMLSLSKHARRSSHADHIIKMTGIGVVRPSTSSG
jgi:aspartate carbamoyltransferase regulatory subunit